MNFNYSLYTKKQYYFLTLFYIIHLTFTLARLSVNKIKLYLCESFECLIRLVINNKIIGLIIRDLKRITCYGYMYEYTKR